MSPHHPEFPPSPEVYTFDIPIDEKGESPQGTKEQEQIIEKLESIRSARVRITIEVFR